MQTLDSLRASPRGAGLHASEDDAGAIGKIVDDTDLTHAGGAAQGGCLVEVSLIAVSYTHLTLPTNREV